MTLPYPIRATSHLLVAGIFALPLTLSAQSASPTQEPDWRRANDAVGVLKRGHADVLKWEQANPTADIKGPISTSSVAISTAEAAVRMAWRVHRDLARPLARLGPQNEQLIAEGRWMELSLFSAQQSEYLYLFSIRLPAMGSPGLGPCFRHLPHAEH